jgi:hypothetical protein
MYPFFPSFIVEVDTATDCHFLYALIGRAATMSSLDYVQPIQAQNSASATASTPPPAPVIIEADNDDVPSEALPTYVSHWPNKPPAPPAPPVILPFIPPPAYSVHLKDLTHEELIQCLYSVEHAQYPDKGDNIPAQRSPPVKLECMSNKEIFATLYHPHSCLPPVQPCATPNALETKRTYTPEELHRLTGCCRFCNYQHIIILFPARKTVSC